VLFEFFEQPSLASEALLVDAPLGRDAVVAFLLAGACACASSSRDPAPVGVANIGKNRLPPGFVV
jgi:hypothetical protein